MPGSAADDDMRVREDYGEEVQRGVWLERREKGIRPWSRQADAQRAVARGEFGLEG